MVSISFFFINCHTLCNRSFQDLNISFKNIGGELLDLCVALCFLENNTYGIVRVCVGFIFILSNFIFWLSVGFLRFFLPSCIVPP
jgi:hypothetical protein